VSWNVDPNGPCADAPVTLAAHRTTGGDFNQGENQPLVVWDTVQASAGTATITLPNDEDPANCRVQLDTVLGGPLAMVGPSGSYYSPWYRTDTSGAALLLVHAHGAYTCEVVVTTTVPTPPPTVPPTTQPPTTLPPATTVPPAPPKVTVPPSTPPTVGTPKVPVAETPQLPEWPEANNSDYPDGVDPLAQHDSPVELLATGIAVGLAGLAWLSRHGRRVAGRR
jgi:hypothetical protein